MIRETTLLKGSFLGDDIMRSCKTCQWMTPDQECRRYPPALLSTGEAAWPTVRSSDVCGEWREGNYASWSGPGPTVGEKLGRSVAIGMGRIGNLSRDTTNRTRSASAEVAAVVMRRARQVTEQVGLWGNAVLATEAALATDRWLRDVFSSPATIYDKAMDAAYNASHIGGGNHRLFDGGHDLVGAWEAVAHASAAQGDSFGTQVAGYASAVWKDLVTPKGLPFFTLDKESFDAVSLVLQNNLGISKDWLVDIASFTATEVVGAAVAAAAAAFGWGKVEIENFSTLVGSFGLSAIAGANPLLGLVAVLCLAHAVRQLGDDNADRSGAIYGAAKGAAGAGAAIAASAAVTSVGGPVLVGALVGIAAGLGVHRLSEKIRYGLSDPKSFKWSEVQAFFEGSRGQNPSNLLSAPTGG